MLDMLPRLLAYIPKVGSSSIVMHIIDKLNQSNCSEWSSE
jgi:hypothetical protein